MLLPGLTTRLHGYVLSPWRSTYEASPVRGRERSQSRRSTSPWTVLSAAALTRASRVVRVAMCVLAASAAPALMHELLLRAQHLQAACAMHVLRLRACAPLSLPQHTAHSAHAAHTARTASSTLSTNRHHNRTAPMCIQCMCMCTCSSVQPSARTGSTSTISCLRSSTTAALPRS